MAHKRILDSVRDKIKRLRGEHPAMLQKDIAKRTGVSEAMVCKTASPLLEAVL